MHRGIVSRRESCSVVKPNNLILSLENRIIFALEEPKRPGFRTDFRHAVGENE